jgi:electron transport complex protein RnfE
MNERKLLFQNPAALLFLGAVPALGASATVKGALGMSVAVVGVLVLSALVLALLRGLIGEKARLAAAVLVVAGFASAAQLLLHALLPSAWEMLGVYLAVLAADLLLFASAEDALEFGLGKGLLNALLCGLIFTVFVLILAAIRELFGSAAFAGNPVEALEAYKIPLLAKFSGGMIVFAILLALVNAICPAKDAVGALTKAAAGLAEEKEVEA